MLSTPRQMRQFFMESDVALQQLEHRESEAPLEQLERSAVLSGDDRICLATVKKFKLRIRD